MENKGFAVREGRTEIDVPHQNGILTFIHPYAGPNTFAKVGEQIDAKNLQRPTYAQTTFLAHTAWQNQDNKYSDEIIKLLKSNWFWGFNGILYVPNKGAFVEDNPKVVDGRVSMNHLALVKRLESGDKAVRFAPFGFKTGEQSAKDLAKNAFVIALAGEEGAEKLAEVADNYSAKPYVYSFDKIDQETVRVPALYASCGGRLSLRGSSYGGDRGGCAFGVFGAGEASARKNI